jgi:starch phosphorylase
VVPPIDYASVGVQEQDRYDLDQLYKILNEEILPLYYDDQSTWRQIVKNGMRDVQFRFDSNRMAEQYYELLYNREYVPVPEAALVDDMAH